MILEDVSFDELGGRRTFRPFLRVGNVEGGYYFCRRELLSVNGKHYKLSPVGNALDRLVRNTNLYPGHLFLYAENKAFFSQDEYNRNNNHYLVNKQEHVISFEELYILVS